MPLLPLPRGLGWRSITLGGALIPLSLFAQTAPAPGRVVDFRYGIPTWHQPLGVPDDWHKAQADERGALLYDFGPGPYAIPTTVVEASAAGASFQRSSQSWVDSARLPVVRTLLKRGSDSLEVVTLSLPPETPAPSLSRTEAWERIDGITGALGWANPSVPASPEFRNVAWGITRPIRYRVRVSPGTAKRVMLGFCESYKPRLDERIADMHVEGAAPLQLDLAISAGRNQPQVFLFDASDADRNGWIDIAVMAPQGRDPNTTLATIAVYPAGIKVTRDELIAGSTFSPDRAELRIACGTEARRQSPRTDLIHARYAGTAQPVLAIRTGRQLTFTADGVVNDGDRPFVATVPRAERLVRADDAWKLEFPSGTQEITASVFSGQTTAEEVTRARSLSWNDALARTRAQWAKIRVPYGHVTVADPAIQGIIDASLRTVYQARESINGQGQFNSSFSLYRGLWAGDAIYLAELAAMLGESPAGRESLEVLFQAQNAKGLIDEMPPQVLFRTTAMVLWTVERDAQITGNWDFARAHWPQIERAVQALRTLREQTLAQPDLPYSGLFPPGFNDGGIIEIGAEYSSVYWAISGLTATARTARALGRERESKEIAELAAGFRASFDLHRKRDQRRDAKGNLYLPVRVGFTGNDPTPQLAQWGVVEAHFLGGWLPLDGELLKGSLGMLEAVEQQGIPVSTGWLPDGIWAGFGALYAHLPLILGQHQKTADLLYAVANHASPLGTWVEEQSRVGAPVKLAGDQPHCWASALFVRLAGSMLAYDREDTLHLLAAVPAEWLRAGAVNRLDQWHTGTGRVTLALTVSADGRTATLEVEPIQRTDKKIRIIVHPESLAQAGFTAAGPASAAPLQLAPGKSATLSFTRTGNRASN